MFGINKKKIEELEERIETLSQKTEENNLLLNNILEMVNSIVKKQVSHDDTFSEIKSSIKSSADADALSAKQLMDSVYIMQQNQTATKELLTGIRQTQLENNEQIPTLQQTLAEKLDLYSNMSVKQAEILSQLNDNICEQFAHLKTVCENAEDEIRMILIHSVLGELSKISE